jgi:hypothetical protein
MKSADAGIFQKHASGVGMKSALQPWQILLLILAAVLEHPTTIESLFDRTAGARGF